MLRHYDATSPSSQSIKWNCHGPDVVSQGGFGKGFTGCNSYPGFAAEIRLPFCYDGVNEFDLKNPYAHVVYGQGSDGTILQEGGVCPSSHPIALPQLFMEMSHDTSRLPSWGADEQPFVLSPGDNTGYSFHVDFVSFPS